jgi:hypothetical protein
LKSHIASRISRNVADVFALSAFAFVASQSINTLSSSDRATLRVPIRLFIAELTSGRLRGAITDRDRTIGWVG